MQRGRKVQSHRWSNPVLTQIHTYTYTYTHKHNLKEKTSYLCPIKDSAKRSISRSHGFGLTPADRDLTRLGEAFSMNLSND